MWSLSLLWVLRWILLAHMTHRAECGRFVTTSLKTISYLQNVSEQNYFVFALKGDTLPRLYFFNQTFEIGGMSLRVRNNSKEVIFQSGCGHYYYTHTSDLVTLTEYSWLWIRWTTTQLEFGTGKIPSVDLAHSEPMYLDIKYIGFAKSDGNVESHWIVGQTNELTNESVFKRKKNIRILDSVSQHTVKSTAKCALLCINLNGCYSFNLSKTANKSYVCELIKIDIPTGDCYNPLFVDWKGDIESGWSNYYL